MRRKRSLVGVAIALVVVALAPPLDRLADRHLVAHMGQHVLVGDLAPLLLVAALPSLVTDCYLGIALWALSRSVWHVPVVFDAAARHPALHQLEHASLFLGGAALWAAVLRSGRVPGRIAALVAFQLGGMALGLVLIWSGSPLYAHSSGLGDQRAAGAVMMATGTAIAFGLAAWLLLGLLREERSG